MYEKNNRIYHVEIDEHAHSAYNSNSETERENTIRNYFMNSKQKVHYSSYTLVRYNPHNYIKDANNLEEKIMAAEAFAKMLFNIDGVTNITVTDAKQIKK